MDIKSTDLPGVGKKISFTTSDDEHVALVIHHSGKRELFFFEDEDEEELGYSIELTDEESKEIAAQLMGVTYQPINSDSLKLFRKKLMLEWVKVKENTSFAGKTLEESSIRDKTGVSVMAIMRGDDEEMIVNPQADETIQRKDTLMVAGNAEQMKEFERFCKEKGE